jgi:signal transduction histidine kinase
MNPLAEGTLRRTVSGTIALAVLAVGATALLSWLSYRAVRSSLEAELVRRVENVAAAIASQVSPADIEDAQLFGEDGTGYGTIFLLVEELRATTRVANASVIDTARVCIYDGRGREHEWTVSRLDTLVPHALGRALAGEAVVSPVYQVGGAPLRAAFARVGSGDHVSGVVAVEVQVDYLAALAGFGRTMILTTLIISLTMAVLAALFVRRTWSSARLERRLSRAENLAAMGRLTATLAHEIKNPLAIIRGSAQRLGKLEPEAQRMADYLVDEADRLSRTVGRYLQFARGAASALDEDAVLAPARGDARATLEQTLDLLEGEFQARRVVVEREPNWPEEPAEVALDDESLKQVYLNLVLNALDAMPDGGRITVGMAAGRGEYRVRIADTGGGIEPEVLKRLGSPFFTTKAKGSGIGLFLTRRLVRSAGGDLQIDSVLARGTSCLVRLPGTTSAGSEP